MSQDLDTQYFGEPGEPGTPGNRAFASQRSNAGPIPSKHVMGGGQIVDLIRTAEKIERLDRRQPEGPYKAGSRLRRAAARIEELEKEVRALRIAVQYLDNPEAVLTYVMNGGTEMPR